MSLPPVLEKLEDIHYLLKALASESNLQQQDINAIRNDVTALKMGFAMLFHGGDGDSPIEGLEQRQILQRLRFLIFQVLRSRQQSRRQFRRLRFGLDDIDDDIDDLEETLTSIEDDVEKIEDFTSCGGHGWTQVADLDFDYDDCPAPFTSHTDNGIDTCGRTTGEGAMQCSSTSFPVFKNYQRICGQIIGYQFGAANAFEESTTGTATSLDDAYVSGVSLTIGAETSRTHIWTFAVGRGEGDGMDQGSCPCDFDEGFGIQPPEFVENDYFCESGVNGVFNGGGAPEFFNNRLWNGEGCEINSCCSFNAPPYFVKDLHVTTSDDIELRLCGADAAADEDVRVARIEIYVQ